MNITPLKPKILSIQMIQKITPALAKQYGIENPEHISLGLVTCDMDDPLYVALDEATKHAQVEVVYAKSFYAGSAHASGPLAGEVIGVIASSDPAEVLSGLKALQICLQERAWFYSYNNRINFFPHVVSSVGHYLSKVAGVPVGSSLAYLIACPMEAMMGLDAAMKAANVELAKFYAPPSETNFGGALLSGSLTECQAAARAFTEEICRIAEKPVSTVF